MGYGCFVFGYFGDVEGFNVGFSVVIIIVEEFCCESE